MSDFPSYISSNLPNRDKFTAAKFTKSFKQAAKSGQLKHLGDHADTLHDIAKKRQSAIRRGNYDLSRRKSDYQEVVNSSPNMSTKQKDHIKKIFEHWSQEPAPAKKEAPQPKPQKLTQRTDYGRSLPDFLQNRSKISAVKPSENKNKPFSPSTPSQSGARPKSNYFSNKPSSGASTPSKPSGPPKLPKLF